jgi:hypothetical protein
MRIRLLFGALVAALVLAVPTVAAASPLNYLVDNYHATAEPIPGGRGDISFGSDENPCRYYSYDASRQDGYSGSTLDAETWKQFGQAPTLLPPGTFWEKENDWGYFPAEKGAVEATPADVTSVPQGARFLKPNQWTVTPNGRTPFQPETTLACSDAYTMDYAGPWSPLFSKGAQATAVCKDAQSSTPFVQWVQDLENETPALFEGLSTSKALISAFESALGNGAGKTAKTVFMNAFKQLWGGKPGSLLGVSVVQSVLSAAVDGYLKSVAEQTRPMVNAVWDYTVNGGNLWSYWAPLKSRMTDGKLSINIVSSNPASQKAMIMVSCSSTPAIQGNVLKLNVNGGKNLRFPEETHGPAYFGKPVRDVPQSNVMAREATASEATADGSDQDKAGSETIIGSEMKQLDVATGPGNDEVFGSPGDDVLKAGSGDDKVIGGPGSDELIGGAGEDLLVDHSAEPNTFIGGDGTDRIDARHMGDQVDTINCGAGEDIVLADPQDDVSDNCEHVFFSTEEAPHNLEDALNEPRNWPR